MDTRSDIELVQAYNGGDASAFDALVYRYTKSMFAFVFRLVGDAAVAQDITQEIFMKLWKHVRKFDTEKHLKNEQARAAYFKSWLFTIARNASIDWLRKRRAAAFSEIDVGKSGGASDPDDSDQRFEDTLADTVPLAHELFEKKETALLVENLLIELHPDDKTIIMLHHYEDLTFDQISEIMKKPMNTTKSRYRRAMKKLSEKARENKPQLSSAPK
jgi:RNA polymerase sigma factor (sigma-70 family)